MVVYKAAGKRAKGLSGELEGVTCVNAKRGTAGAQLRLGRRLTIEDTCPKGQLTGPSGNRIMGI